MPRGNVCFSADYFPYGQELDYTTTCNTSYKFTGYERDAETGNDYAFARYYNPRLSRFMSEDPGPRDITDPQTLNRYAYVRNNSANMTDRTGLCSDFVDDSSCDDGISFSWGVDASAWESRNGPQPAIYSPPAAGHDPNPFDGETNGIPNGMQIPTLGLPGLILPGDPGCPYGAGSCGGGAGNSFIGLDDAAEAGFCLVQPEICGGVIAITVTAYYLYTHNLLRPWYEAKGGTREVGHDYVRNMARAKPGDYCSNLKTIMDAARKAGNSKLFNDAKATWKQDCRGR